MLSDPSSISTSALTLAANQDRTEGEEGSLLDVLITALVEPVPFGVDGEMDKDETILLGEFESDPDPTFHSRIGLTMLMLTTELYRILYMFATSCNSVFSAVQKRSLQEFWGGIATTQGEENLNFGLTSGERGCEVIVRCGRGS
ncbi:hypothetical protein EV702DRAFT_1234583 [Suillus placidus]|uniref:Uncharacterized protein n=1 Tax=Suillus placidus TaxID=48579 RepID=A0A9P7D138_9AGAM|nr:hypothetical protein EV702DRAFT_1234583 [Suillus placidus]